MLPPSVSPLLHLQITTICFGLFIFLFCSLFASLGISAPKRKKPRHVKYEDENSSRVTTIKSEAEAPSKSQVPFGDQLKSSGSGEGNSSVLDSISPLTRESNASLDSRSAEKKENNLSKEETLLPKVESSSGFRSDGDGATILGAKS